MDKGVLAPCLLESAKMVVYYALPKQAINIQTVRPWTAVKTEVTSSIEEMERSYQGTKV